MATVGSGKTNCSSAVLDAIYGKTDAAAKKQAYDKSLGSWWKEYAARKNDEEEEHVADSLLYDERCHLPRSAPRPDVVNDKAPKGDGDAGKNYTAQ
jgi:hypothetical protein